jgi:hypothetical protein
MHGLLPVWKAIGVLTAAMLVGWLAPRPPGDMLPFARLTGTLGSRTAPWVIGAVTAAIVWYAWGYLHPTATVHDEASYLLQAQTFAAGRWSNPAPPIAEFFEQFHVLVTPTFSSKYPPGTALLMVPGIWLGVPALTFVVLAGVTGAFVFVLARRMTNVWIALITWGIWISAPATLWWATGYFSEIASAALWMAGWWALLQWRDSRRARWLVFVALSTAWMAITRPLTAVAYGIPLGVVVLWLVARRVQWRQLVVAAVAGTGVLMLLPISNHAVAGSWRTMPWSVYSEQYLPSDRFGFGVAPNPPQRQAPADMRAFNDQFMRLYEAHVPSALPRIAYRRLVFVTTGALTSPRVVLLPLMIVGAMTFSAEVALATASAALLFLMYLGYAHETPWTLYYHEIQPTLAFIAALGLWRVSTFLSRHRVTSSDSSTSTVRPAFTAAALMVLALPYFAGVVARTREGKRAAMAGQRTFRKTLSKLPGQQAIVFVRYAPSHNPHRSVIANDADLPNARVWLVYDRGTDNERLLRTARNRVPYLFDEASGTIMSYAAVATSPADVR